MYVRTAAQSFTIRSCNQFGSLVTNILEGGLKQTNILHFRHTQDHVAVVALAVKPADYFSGEFVSRITQSIFPYVVSFIQASGLWSIQFTQYIVPLTL